MGIEYFDIIKYNSIILYMQLLQTEVWKLRELFIRYSIHRWLLLHQQMRYTFYLCFLHSAIWRYFRVFITLVTRKFHIVCV